MARSTPAASPRPAVEAMAVTDAFRRSEALLRPDDPRRLLFTVLPGHGILCAEKWVPGTAPFQVLWELMDEGLIQASS